MLKARFAKFRAPFSMPSAPDVKLRLQLSANGRRVQAVIEPRPDASFTEHEVREQLDSMGCGDWVVFKETVANLPKLFKSVKTAMLADIAEKRDAEITLSVSSDELTAYLTLVPACGGAPAAENNILALLAQHKVTHGILLAAVTAVVQSQTADRVVVAQGTAPVSGDDACFASELPHISDRRPQENQDSDLNYREISMFFLITPDTPLLRKIPFTLGTPGQTVTGKIIPAQAGHDLPFSALLSGVKFDATDKNLLLAAIRGQAIMIEQGVWVEPVIEFNNVDLSSGNIDFDGTVNISGDVATGVRIRTRSDIFVAGTVAGATLEAGGNIKVNKGVIGRGDLYQEDGTPGTSIALLKAQGCVQAQFVNNAIIVARGDVIIDELLAHCEVTAKGTLVVGKDNAKNGHILGGNIIAVRGIKARVIGSAAGVRTNLEAGLSRMLRKNLDDARETIIVKCAERDKLSALLKRSAQLQEDLVRRTQRTLATVEEELKQLNTQRTALQQQLRQDLNARIAISMRTHEGTTLLLGEKTLAVNHEHGPGTFTLHDGKIVFTPD